MQNIYVSINILIVIGSFFFLNSFFFPFFSIQFAINNNFNNNFNNNKLFLYINT